MKNHTGQDPFSSDSLYSTRVENSQRPCFTGCKETLRYYVQYLRLHVISFGSWEGEGIYTKAKIIDGIHSL